MRSRLALFALALALLAVAGSSGFLALRTVRRQVQAGEICAAVSESRWQDALAGGESAAGPDDSGRFAAECLCWAYTATQQPAACTDLLERVLADEGALDWLPDPALLRMLVRARRDAGQVEAAAALAERAGRAHPEDGGLAALELETRALGEDEAQVIAALEARLPRDFLAGLPLRLVLARAHERRGDFAAELALLGDTPPPRGHPQLEEWFELRAAALGSRQDFAGLRENYARWQALGGKPAEMQARYAIRYSMYGAEDAEHTQLALLQAALAQEAQLENDDVRRMLYERVLGRLLVDGRTNDALAVYDQAAKRYPGMMVSREELLRTAEAGKAGGATGDAVRGEIAFAAPEGSPIATLHVSRDAPAPPDSAYERFALAKGREVRIERDRTQHPVRWVARDAAGATRASGTVWPERERQRVEIHASEPLAPRRFEPELRAGDGRRRVFVVINDCEDWRLLQYLRERGEAPVQDRALALGYSAVLTSAPAFTGAAMESLVWPTRGRTVSFVALANRLGMELEGLSSVDQNPLRFLEPLLPEGENLFERVGADDRVAANFLFAHGTIDAGRNAELIGPFGKRRPAQRVRALRPLGVAEREDLPEAMREPRYRTEVEKMAAELDTARELAASGEIDFLVLRVEPLDLLTHGFFTSMLRPGQDDGAAALLWAYRYIDRRLGEVWNELDQDDVFVIMSDHGIRTGLEHEEDAIFVAVGGGLPRGRAAGAPHLRGVASFLAGLFDVRTTWPDTGLVAPGLAKR